MRQNQLYWLENVETKTKIFGKEIGKGYVRKINRERMENMSVSSIVYCAKHIILGLSSMYST